MRVEQAGVDRIAQLLGTHQGRMDAKKRISVPAAFRNALRDHAAHGPVPGPVLVLSLSLDHPCLEVWPRDEFDLLANDLRRLERFSETRKAYEVALFGESCEVEPDKEGRIVLPEDFVAHAGLSDSVTFIGAGSSFQIWEPEAARRRRAEAREHARTHRPSLATLPEATA